MKKKNQPTKKKGQLAILLTRKAFEILVEQGVNPETCHVLNKNEVIVMMSTDGDAATDGHHGSARIWQG